MALLRTVTLLVKLNATTSAPTTVLEYEVPILEELHGGSEFGDIKEVDSGTLEVDTDDTAALYDNLKAKYRGKTGDDAVRLIYPQLRTFEAAVKAAAVKPEKASKEKASKDADPEAKD